MPAPDEQRNEVPCGNQRSRSVPAKNAAEDPNPGNRAQRVEPEQPQQQPGAIARRRPFKVAGRFTVCRVKSPEPNRHVRFSSEIVYVGGSPEHTESDEGSDEGPRGSEQGRLSRWSRFQKNVRMRSPPRPPATESDDD